MTVHFISSFSAKWGVLLYHQYPIEWNALFFLSRVPISFSMLGQGELERDHSRIAISNTKMEAKSTMLSVLCTGTPESIFQLLFWFDFGDCMEDHRFSDWIFGPKDKSRSDRPDSNKSHYLLAGYLLCARTLLNAL